MTALLDKYLSEILEISEETVRDARTAAGIVEGWEGVHVSSTEDSAYYYSATILKMKVHAATIRRL